MHLFVVSIYVVETPKARIKDHEPPLPKTSFGIVEYSFTTLNFKQLYLAIRTMVIVYKFDRSISASDLITMLNKTHICVLTSLGKKPKFLMELLV